MALTAAQIAVPHRLPLIVTHRSKMKVLTAAPSASGIAARVADEWAGYSASLANEPTVRGCAFLGL